MRSGGSRILAAAGIAAPLLWAGAVIYCGAARPGYSHVTQFMSELAERGSSTESVMRIAGFYLPGLLVVMFALHLLSRSAGWPVAALLIIHGVGRVTAGMFPCDPGCPAPGASVSQAVHNAAAMVNGLSVPAAAFVCSVRLWKIGRSRFAAYSLVSAIVGTVFLVLMVMNLTTRSHVGVFQRLSFGTMNLWLAVFALSSWPSRIEASDRSAGGAD
jgi:hypothetical membrane protein